MKHKSLIIFLIIAALYFFGCSSGSSEQVNSSELRKIIVQALAGDYDANVTLKGLFSVKHIGKSDYNQLAIDSFKVNDKSYYTILLEYFDPTLNLFAIYDSNLNFYLLDKSLNGNLSAEWVSMGTRNFAFLQERFLTKDVLGLDRLSIYEITDESAQLIYRSLSRFVSDNEISNQTVEIITKDYILTELSGLKDKAINNQPDTFYFDAESKKYLSRWNLFNKYVKQQIKEFSWITTKPQIPSEMLDDGKTRIRSGYTINLNSEWEEIPFYEERVFLTNRLTGTKYSNKIINTSFTIFEIPSGKMGEDYSPYGFGEANRGDYQIRATPVYELNDNYYQIFEHTCGAKKYLLMLECPKRIYMSEKKSLDQIIGSFTINC